MPIDIKVPKHFGAEFGLLVRPSLQKLHKHYKTASMLRVFRCSTQSVTTLRQFCTELKGLPSIYQLLDKLPTTVHAEATKLTRAIDQARAAIDIATEDDSDTVDRKDALARTRYALILYKRLAERVEPFPSTMPNGLPKLNFHHDNGQRDRPVLEPDSSSASVKNGPRKPDANAEGRNTYYAVPTAKDAYASELAECSNAVVRVFGPHMAELRHSAYISHRQRLWIGWDGWF